MLIDCKCLTDAEKDASAKIACLIADNFHGSGLMVVLGHSATGPNSMIRRLISWTRVDMEARVQLGQMRFGLFLLMMSVILLNSVQQIACIDIHNHQTRCYMTHKWFKKRKRDL